MTEIIEPAGRTVLVDRATCAGVSTRPATTSSGARGSVKFEVSLDAARGLIDSVTGQAFAASFGGHSIGEGLTIKSILVRPDAEGAGRAFASFAVPQSEAHHLAVLIERDLVGASGQLALDSSQMTMADVLARRTE